MHLNRSKTQKKRCNTLRNFSLYGVNKYLPSFRCGGKGKHLNLAARQNPATNPLTTNALQDFQQLRQRFRSLAGLEHHRLQIYPGGASCRSIYQTRNRTAQASEPEQNPKKSSQHIEKLSITRFWQASPPVQMQRKRRASEPCIKAESSRQPTHNKHIAGLSVTVPMVQIPTGFGTPQNANTPWRCFLQGYPPNTQQNSPGI